MYDSVLQVPGNEADAAPCERKPQIDSVTKTQIISTSETSPAVRKAECEVERILKISYKLGRKKICCHAQPIPFGDRFPCHCVHEFKEDVGCQAIELINRFKTGVLGDQGRQLYGHSFIIIAKNEPAFKIVFFVFIFFIGRERTKNLIYLI